ncbi:MAG: hypothetical protein NWF01_12070 [Candidatus Bathyarchaeota archaeon]|nr:hypothetical protein [Candidatus Bathyarchaeota archaeon]
MFNKINFIGLAAGIAMLLLLAISYYVPWWVISIGTVAQINLSPVNFSMALFGETLNQPLIWAMNMIGILTLLSAGIIMIIYSILPNKPYSKKLLGYGYSKPVFIVGMFIAELAIMYFSVKALTGFDFPVIGSSTLQMSVSNVSISVTANSSLLWPVYFAIAVAILCVAARVYHRKVAQPTVPPATVSPATVN